MDKLTDLIKVYDSVFTPEQCTHFINLIDNGPQFMGKVSNKEDLEGKVKPTIKNAWDVNLSREYPADANLIVKVLNQQLAQYCIDVGFKVPYYGTEAIFGRVYKEGEGFYKAHVDAGCAMTIDRILSVLIYLSDIEGGDLEFPRLKYSIHPKPGRMVIFPSSWMYLHGANVPTKGDRYGIRIFVMGSNHDIKPATMHFSRIQENAI